MRPLLTLGPTKRASRKSEAKNPSSDLSDLSEQSSDEESVVARPATSMINMADAPGISDNAGKWLVGRPRTK